MTSIKSNFNSDSVSNYIPRNQLSLDFYLKFWDIDENKRLVYERGPLGTVYKKLLKNGSNLMHANEFVYAKKSLGRFHPFFRAGTFVREGILSDKNRDDRLIWLRNSIASTSLENLEDAIRSNKSRIEHYPGNVDEYLSKLDEGSDYMIVDDFSPIRVKTMHNDYRAKWLFQNQVKVFKKLLENCTDATEIKISRCPISGTTMTKNESFASQMYLSAMPGPFVDYAFIGGTSGRLHDFGYLFGLQNRD